MPGQIHSSLRHRQPGPSTVSPFGLAVVLASLYPGITVLLARVILGERLHWAQRTGLGLAAIGVILLAA